MFDFVNKFKFPTRDIKKVGSWVFNKIKPPKKDIKIIREEVFKKIKPPVSDFKTASSFVFDKIKPPVKDFKTVGEELQRKIIPPTREFFRPTEDVRVRDIARELPSTGTKMLKLGTEMFQSMIRESGGGIGMSLHNLFADIKDPSGKSRITSYQPTKDDPKIEQAFKQFIFGKEAVKPTEQLTIDLGDWIKEAGEKGVWEAGKERKGAPEFENIFRKQLMGTLEKHPMLSAMVAVPAITVMDFTGFGAGKQGVKNFFKYMAKTNDVLDISKGMRQVGVADDIIEVSAPKIAKMKNPIEIENAFKKIELLQKSTKVTPKAVRPLRPSDKALETMRRPTDELEILAKKEIKADKANEVFFNLEDAISANKSLENKNFKLALKNIDELQPTQPLVRDGDLYNAERVKMYVEDMKKGDIFDPIVIDRAGNIWDGHSRFEAMMELGKKNIPVLQEFGEGTGKIVNLEDLAKPTLPKADPLITEARKYKSAEEFVESKPKGIIFEGEFFHATDDIGAESILKSREFKPSIKGGGGLDILPDFGRGAYFDLDYGNVGQYGERIIKAKTKSKLLLYEADSLADKGFVQKNVDKLKKQGYDGAIYRKGNLAEQEIVIFEPKNKIIPRYDVGMTVDENAYNLKTQFQSLTDIYNKAKTLPEAKPIAKIKAEEGVKLLPKKKGVETPSKKVSRLLEAHKRTELPPATKIEDVAYKDIRNKLSTKILAQVKKLSSIPASKVKTNIHKMVNLKKSDELKKLNEYYAEEAKIALEKKSLTEFKRASAISKEIEKNIKAKIKPLEIKKDISKTDLEVDEIDIIKKEYPTEFAIGKMEKEQKMIEASSEGFFDELSKMKLSDIELKNVFDYRETRSIFKLEKFSSKQVEKIKKINNEITKITSYIDDKLEGFGLLDERLDENTYIRAYLRNLDGSPASLDKITQLRIDQGANFRELMSSASQKIKKSTIKETRKYETADARDAVLKKYGLKTDRDLLRVMTNYISSMNGMIGNYTLNNTLRAIARSGKKSIPTKGASILKGRIVSKSAIREIYNPKDLTKFRTGLSKELKATREELLELAKTNRVLTDDQIKIIQKSKKPLLKTESDDILEELGAGTKDIKEFFDEVLENVKGVKKETTEMIKEKIKEAKTGANLKLRSKYEDIAKQKAVLEEQGFKDLGVRGAEPLRGVMGQKLERDFIEEIVKVRSTTSIAANLDQISQTGKLMMAVGDLFSIPRAWWLSVQTTGMIKGSRAFWDDIMGITFKKRTPERISESAEFIRTDRQAIGDVDTLKKFKGEIDRELSAFEKFIDKVDTLTDIKGIQQAKEGVVNAFQNLENWQFKKLMTSTKDRILRIKTEELVRKGYSQREVKLEVGRITDILSGVSNFKKIMAKHPKAFSQSIQRGLRISLFAPNLFVTMGRMLKTYGIDIFAGGARGALARQATIRMLIWSQVILQSLSFALNEHSTFENEDKKKILALKVPGMLDEKGNQYYLNPLGWIAKPFDLVMRPNESAMNKIALLPRFAMNLFLSPYKYEDPSKSRIGGALSGVVPLPFTLQGLLNYGMSKFQEDEQYGVAENVQQQMMLSMLEFFGFEGVYTSGKAKTTVATDVMKQVKEAFDDPNNFKNLPIYIENWLLSKDLPSEPKSEYDKAVAEDKEKDKEAREAIRPKFDEIQKLIEEGREEEAKEIGDKLSDEEYEIYKKIKSSEKTKDTNKKKEEFYPRFLEIREIGEKDRAKAMKIINSLTDEEYRIYELLRNQLE